MNISMAEPTLDSLLKAIHDIDSCSEAKHNNGCLSGLGYIKKIIEKRLSRM